MSCDDTTIYDVGDEAILTGVFTDPDGVNVDPTTVKAYSKPPASATVELTPVSNTAVGVYEVTLTITAAGMPTPIEPGKIYKWHYVFAGTGTNAALQENWISVRQPTVTLP